MNNGLSHLEPVWMAAAYLLLVNAWEFGLFAWDKSCARKGRWRVSERMLLSVALIGGSPGAMVGQRLLRHKSRKQPFRSQLLIIVALQAAAIVLVSAPDLRNALVTLAG